MLKHSAAISKFLEDKPNCFKLAKEMAVFADSGRHFFRCENFFKALEAKGLVSAEMCWGSCTRGIEQNLAFLGDEATVLAQLAELKPKETRHVPTPATVMAKMVAGRLGKLHDLIELENRSIVSANEYAMNNPSSGQQLRALISQLQFSDMADRFKSIPRKYWFLKKCVDEFASVLDRKEMKKAFDMYNVRVVMHS
jgi:hypothetical protein